VFSGNVTVDDVDGTAAAFAGAHGTAKSVIRALHPASGAHSLVVPDLSSFDDATLLGGGRGGGWRGGAGSALRLFAERGGLVIFCGGEPAFVLPLLSDVFSLPWHAGTHHRGVHPPSALGPATRGAEGFRGVAPFSAKSWFLRGVQSEDQVFVAGPRWGESEDDTAAAALAAEASGAATNGSADADTVDAGADVDVAVAAVAVGAGCVVVIGDLNGEWGTAALVRRLCGVHGVAPHRGAAVNVLGSF
jgi:hypothetical protein